MRSLRLKIHPQLLVSLLLFFSLSSACALFQADPVGSSLFAMKDAYESTVRTAGQAYIMGQINDSQLKNFVNGANQFYTAYTLAVSLHESNNLQNPDDRIAELRKSLDALQLMIQQLTLPNKLPRPPTVPAAKPTAPPLPTK